MELRPGWLNRQFAQVDKDVAQWPEWMRQEAGFDDNSLTPKQRRDLATMLRKRADELDAREKGGK